VRAGSVVGGAHLSREIHLHRCDRERTVGVEENPVSRRSGVHCDAGLAAMSALASCARCGSRPRRTADADDGQSCHRRAEMKLRQRALSSRASLQRLPGPVPPSRTRCSAPRRRRCRGSPRWLQPTLVSENLADLAHGQSLGRQASPHSATHPRSGPRWPATRASPEASPAISRATVSSAPSCTWAGALRAQPSEMDVDRIFDPPVSRPRVPAPAGPPATSPWVSMRPPRG